MLALITAFCPYNPAFFQPLPLSCKIPRMTWLNTQEHKQYKKFCFLICTKVILQISDHVIDVSAWFSCCTYLILSPRTWCLVLQHKYKEPDRDGEKTEIKKTISTSSSHLLLSFLRRCADCAKQIWLNPSKDSQLCVCVCVFAYSCAYICVSLPCTVFVMQQVPKEAEKKAFEAVVKVFKI